MRLVILLALTFGILSCETVDVERQLEIPENYDGSSFETNASAELAALEALGGLSTEMKRGRVGEKVDQNVANAFLGTVSPFSTTYFNSLITNDLLGSLISNSGGQQFNPGAQGGVYGSYLFTAYGIENEQLIEKGLYAAAFYNKASQLAANPDEKTADQILALFGAHPDFSSSNNGSLHTNPDRFIAGYIARRDKNDGSGFYSGVKNGLIKFQAAQKAEGDFEKERDEAIQEIFENWEKGSAATAINYIYSVLSKLSATNPDDNAISSALHSYSEVLGFIHGFRTVDRKIITDTEIDEILGLLNVPVGQTPTTLNILSSPSTELAKIVQVLDRLQTTYGFSDQQMEEFRKNWVSEQNR
ncbi:hypothetical protein [Jiulongibacter sediminis]|jgi:hypothetical protein|uniref:hypothetical protein n=1 Tax=Jiulongibacter sediminis TaxID=1605367 RepID=UPI0026EB9060|nr:hypothetical protein [Jiulongibacter sediminis]